MPDIGLPVTAIPFPGATLRRNSPQTAAVRTLQAALNARGCGPVVVDGLFGAATEAAVKLFQSRFLDASGLPLTVDGQVGPVTWAALFGSAAVPDLAAGSALASAALQVAKTRVGVSEQPPGSNRGPEVEDFLEAVGLGPGNAWCAAFVYWCVDQAAAKARLANPLPKTGGVLAMWRSALKAGLPVVTAQAARAQPGLVTAGMIFVMDFGQGHGHTGFVQALASGRLVTIEGNSNNDGSNEGTGVFALTRRTIGGVNTGFIGLP